MKADYHENPQQILVKFGYLENLRNINVSLKISFQKTSMLMRQFFT